jgi:hypothetical protein
MEKAFFLYGNERIEVDHESLTGAQIKAAIKAHDHHADTAFDLVLEGHGHDADKVIPDDQSVDLAIGGGDGGPKRFFLRPPTNFG